MDGSYPLGEGSWQGQAALQDFFTTQGRSTTLRARDVRDWADVAGDLYALEALTPKPRVPRPEQSEAYSLQWFLDIEKQRHSRQGRWIPKLMEFAKHSGELLLGLGHGLGTDWAQYARNGATVMVCSSSTSQLELVRRNFQVRGLDGQFVFADPTCLPLQSASVDVVCLSSLHMGIDNVPAVIEEVYRVLKPGGKVLVVSPARYDVDFWFDTLFFWYRLVKRRKPQADKPRYAFWELKAMFNKFVEHRIHKRQLRSFEVPHVWRWIPIPLLARLMGRVLVLKAFKPLASTPE